ncbi:MAG: hypothetical protein KBT48_05745 [Firmicutes bacterium]|nr:hypothetical protein [Bacillota bacterium]
MEPIDKIDRLRESANVSFEEAREALDETNWDLLDAVVYLENHGKTVQPINTTKSTNKDEIPPLPSVKQVVEDNEQIYQDEEQLPERIKRFARKCFEFLRNNSLKVNKDGKKWFSTPLYIPLILILVSWTWFLIIAIIALFFDVRYVFVGKNSLDKVNQFMDRIYKIVDKIKEEFKKS